MARHGMENLKVDNEFKNLLPPLTEDEYSQLESDIKKHGVLSPIIAWNGFIIDGHNRYEICKKNGIGLPEVKTLDFANKSDVMDWIINHQTGRRNLTKSQLVKAYASVEEQLKREAKERQSAGGGDKKSDKAKSVEVNLPQAVEKKRNPQTSEQVAKKMGVSRKTYEGMKTVVAEGSAEQIKRMDEGGKGNGVSAIVAEIKEEKASKDVPEGCARCVKCGLVKPLNEFSKDAKRKNGHKNVCKECDAKRTKNYKLINKCTDYAGRKVELSDVAKAMTEEDVRAGLYSNVESKVQTFDDDVKVFYSSIMFQFNNAFKIFVSENKDNLIKAENKEKLIDALKELKEAISSAERNLE